MIGFFIFVSFLIHALTITALYVLYQHVKKRKNSEIQEVNTVMQTYVKQIQKENEELKQALHMQSLPNSTKKENSISATDVDYNKVEQSLKVPAPDDWNVEEVVKLSEADSVQTSLESRVLQLHREGISVDEIAKQLHCGKTEASLIIQFQTGK